MKPALVDNDVLIKLAHYGLLGWFTQEWSTLQSLGSARFVIGKRLGNFPTAAQDYETFRPAIDVVELSDTEAELAARVADAAIKRALPLDGGESLLFAKAVAADDVTVVTGDRRAIRAAQQLCTEHTELLALAGRVVCFEQVMLHALEQAGLEIRKRVCGSRDADRALAICFSCFGDIDDLDQQQSCLESYITDTRLHAPYLLAASL